MTVLLVATGGTIASRPSPTGTSRALSGHDLLERAGIDAGVEGVEVLEVTPGPSWAFSPEQVAGIARAAVDGAAGHDGVVVTHGTDTLEESAFLTWLLGGHGLPIVFTGSMRHADHSDADGPANLREAVALARTPVAGPVVRIGGRTHHARWARKADTSDVATFGSSPDGVVAAPPPHAGRVEPAVQEVHGHTGIDGSVLDYLLDRGARGIVLVGTGAGNVHGDLVPGIERALAAAVPVVVTSRCWTGPVLPEYGGAGGGRFLADLGCILAGDLPTNKARLALSVALAVDPSPDAVRAWFAALLG